MVDKNDERYLNLFLRSDKNADFVTRLVCMLEMIPWKEEHCKKLLPALWQYIITYKHDNHSGMKTRMKRVSVGSAIRTYVAYMDKNNLNKLSVLLEPNRLSLDLELEVIKMIGRVFEAVPTANYPVRIDNDLREIFSLYMNPRIFNKDKYSTVAALAIEALFAMKSDYVFRIDYISMPKWFKDHLKHHLVELKGKWETKDVESFGWLVNAIESIRNWDKYE